jgi:hypothetical protein
MVPLAILGGGLRVEDDVHVHFTLHAPRLQ